MRSSVSDPPIPPAQLSQPACRSGARTPSENRLAPASRRTDASRWAVRGGGVSSATVTMVSGLVRSSRRRLTTVGPPGGGGSSRRNRRCRGAGRGGTGSMTASWHGGAPVLGAGDHLGGRRAFYEWSDFSRMRLS
jgi:hypothetical protein